MHASSKPAKKFKGQQQDSNPQPLSSSTNIQPVWLNGWMFVYKVVVGSNLVAGLRVPFVFSCCKILKSITLKTCYEIALTFFWVESKTNMLYVNKNFIGKLFFSFDRYYGKVFPEPSVLHLHSQRMFFQCFFMLTLKV